MKTYTLIIALVSFIVNTTAQSFEFGDLISFNSADNVEKELTLKSLGFSKSDSSQLADPNASSIQAAVWVKGNEEVRFNNSNMEYRWSPNDEIVTKKTKSKTVSTCVGWYMDKSLRSYTKMKKRLPVYDIKNDQKVYSGFTYLVKEDTYYSADYTDNVVFVGDISQNLIK